MESETSLALRKRRLRKSNRGPAQISHPSFVSTLVNSLVLGYGQGTPTFSRADATSCATVTDFEGIVRVVPANCARFQGARLVRNLMTYSEDCSGSGWYLSNITAGNSAVILSGLPTKRLTLTVGASSHYLANNTTSAALVIGHSYWVSAAIDVTGLVTKYVLQEIGGKTVAITWTGPRTISIGGTATTFGYIITGDYQAIFYGFNGSITTTSLALYFGNYGSYTSGSGEYVDVTRFMCEDVTGQANKNPSEYVSVGTGGPLYGPELVTNGDFSGGTTGWTIDASWTVANKKIQHNTGYTVDANGTATFIIGKTYFWTLTVSGRTAGNSAIYIAGVYVGSQNTNTTFSGTLIATNATQLILSASSNFDGAISNISVREALYSGAGVDGIAYPWVGFPNGSGPPCLNGNTVVNNVVVPGTGDVIKAGLLGPELVTNGTFDSGTSGWTAGNTATLAVVSGEMQVTKGAAYSLATQSFPVVIGAIYTVSSVARIGTAGSASLSAGFGGGGTIQYGITSTSSGTNQPLTLQITPTNSTLYITLGTDSGTTGTAYFDNISVKQILVPSTAPVDASGPYGYLAEGSRTNLLTYSQTFSNVIWGLTNTSYASNSIVTPNATTDSATITSTVGGGGSNISQLNTKTSGQSYTFSVFVKVGNVNRINIGQQYGAASFSDNIIDLVTKSIVTTGTGTPGILIQDWGGGWMRVCLTLTATGTGSYISYVGPINTTGTAYNSTTIGNFIYLWGAQLEQASFASTYISTAASAVTRAADVLNYQVTGNVLSTVGGVYAELFNSQKGANTTEEIAVSFGGARALFHQGSGSSTSLQIFDGTTTVSANLPVDMATTVVKAASSWGGSAMSISGGGAAASTGVFSGNMNPTAISIGHIVGVNFWYGSIRNVRIYPTALTSAQLIAMTKP